MNNVIYSKEYLSFVKNIKDRILSAQYNALKKVNKDEYNFDFLEPSDNQLEIEIINKIREFLSVMERDFTFLGNQYKLEIDNEKYFIDLLLYHRQLRALIAIELKIGKFKPEYAGKISFYLFVLNNTIKLTDENPSIGIIICKDKTVVEYASKENNQPIRVATYKTTKSLPNSFKEYLPTANEIEKNLVKFLNMEKKSNE